MNPYTSTGSVSTVASSIADGGSSLGGGDNQTGGGRAAVGPVLRRLMGYVGPHAGTFILSFASAAVSVVLQLYVPILVGRGIDCIVSAGRVDFDALAPLIGQLVLSVVGASAFQWVQGYCVNRLAYETVRDLRVQANDKLFRMPLSTIDAHAHGDFISRVVNDVDQVGDGLLQGLTQLFCGIVTIIGTLVFMLALSVPMAIVVVLVTPLSVLVASLIAKFSNKSFTAQQRIQGRLGGYVEELVGNQ